MTTRLKDKIVQNSKGMSARVSKSVINNGLANILDDMILRLLKKTNTMKAHYFFIQFAHTIRQLLEKGMKYIVGLKMSIKEVSAAITQTLTNIITNLTEHKKIQLRFEPE